MNRKKPLVSIVCITYNHVNFIEEALKSFLMQKTNFPFEIIIHDDASIDGTTDIIKKYAKKHNIIKPIYQKENQWSKGKFPIIEFMLDKIKGKYVAFCEGDDYWTDPLKLQKQVDFLESNKNFSICFHSVKVNFENGESYIYPDEDTRFNKTILELDDLKKRNFIQTNSVMYRWNLKKEEWPKEDFLPCDYLFHLIHASKGKIGFLNDVMSVYRKHNGGIWSGVGQKDEWFIKCGIKHARFYKIIQNKFNINEYDNIKYLVLRTSDILLENGLFKELFDVKQEFPDLYKEFINSKPQNDEYCDWIKKNKIFEKSNVKISVIITTYNQEKYIKECLDSVLMQEDIPSFEIIIGDDCSTDKTTEIIKKYRNKYPDIIKHIIYKKNVGMLQNLKNCLYLSSGEYIAICEGDDYWTFKYKLKKQYDILRSNPDVMLCFTDIKLLIENSKEFVPHIPNIKQLLKNKLNICDLIELENPIGNFSCCMYNRKILSCVPLCFFDQKDVADWLFNMYILSKSEYAFFLKDICSVYRIVQTSMYSSLSNYKKLLIIISHIIRYNDIFHNKYFDSFLILLKRKVKELNNYDCSSNNNGNGNESVSVKNIIKKDTFLKKFFSKIHLFNKKI